MINVVSKNVDSFIPSPKHKGMVLIPAGTFLMGNNEGSDFEKPVHEVYLADYWMDETLVTNQQFIEFIEETGYTTDAECTGAGWGYKDDQFSLVEGLSWKSYALPHRKDHPVVLVSWNDAVAFAQWAGKQLPTEAQWEKAARGGLVGKFYPWGDAPPNRTQCNFSRPPGEMPGTVSVKDFTANGYGLYTMVGNVWQWCADWFGSYCYNGNDTPDVPNSGSHRVRRGGAWNVIQPFRLRCSNRGAMEANSAVPNVGFRCVLKR